MSPEAQRIAIAEACGWKECRCDEGTVNMPPKGEPDDDFNRDVIEHRKCKPYCGYPVDPHREILPDYLSDLDAMHEAWKEKLNNSQLGDRFGRLLVEVVLGYPAQPKTYYQLNPWELARLSWATSAQRAEAFLRTLNFWKD